MANSSLFLKFKVVACMTNINENCRYVCFEDKVLNQYVTFGYLHSSNAKEEFKLKYLSLFTFKLPEILFVIILLIRHFSNLENWIL